MSHRRSAGPIALALAVPIVGWVLVSGVFGDQASVSDGPDDAPAAQIAEVAYPGTALFDHELHTDDLELDCTDCHHEVDAAPLRTPHAEYLEGYWIRCESCHRDGNGEPQEPQACVECHPDTPESVIEETLSSKVVLHRLCSDCHEWGSGLDATESCAFCHEEARRRWEARDVDGHEEGS